MAFGDVDLPPEPEFGDRIIIRLDPGGPVELTGLSESFAALARMYARYYRKDNQSDDAPKLYITKLETGSVIAEIAPIISTYGLPVYQLMVATNAVAGFTKRLNDGLKAFAGIPDVTGAPPAVTPDIDDAADLREFVKPLTGKRNSSLGIKHARFRKTDGQKETVVEYSFDEADINRAAVNMERVLENPEQLILDVPALASSAIKNEVLLVFERASRTPGKEQGRATDWTIVPDVSDKAMPTYFRKSVQGNIKDVMVRGDANPLSDIAFIVDVHVQMKDGQPKAYIVTDFHATVPFNRED